jgi:hypothetical protein
VMSQPLRAKPVLLSSDGLVLMRDSASLCTKINEMTEKNRGNLGSFLKNVYYDPFKWYVLFVL